MLVARGIAVRYEMVRQWGLTFGRDIADSLRRSDKGHLDEGVLIQGQGWLRPWRAGLEPAGRESC